MGINIKEPCDEDWSKMTSTEQGAFCQKCAIDVIDYTSMTPVEIKTILSAELSKPGRSCGKITNIQMDAINNDFYQWKSDQESFRAVWMVSLIAVFGMTLFSCQNTVSKEIVSQMEQNGNEILEQQELAQKKAAEIKEYDSTVKTTVLPETITDTPWEWPREVITTAGGFGGNPWPISESVLICEVIMGDWVLTGVLSSPPLIEPFLEEAELSPLFIEASYSPNSQPQRTFPLPQEQPRIEQKLNAVTGNGNSGFNAFVAPNPIQAESRLHLDIFCSGLVTITIKYRENGKTIHRGSEYFVQAKHQVDLKLYKLEIGEYQMVISFNEIEKNLYFEVPCLSQV